MGFYYYFCSANKARIKKVKGMKVLKFGGTSVGSVDSILSVKRIVKTQQAPVIVVVREGGAIAYPFI